MIWKYCVKNGYAKPDLSVIYFSFMYEEEKMKDICEIDLEFNDIRFSGHEHYVTIDLWEIKDHDEQAPENNWRIAYETLEIFDVKFESREQFTNLFPEYFI